MVHGNFQLEKSQMSSWRKGVTTEISASPAEYIIFGFYLISSLQMAGVNLILFIRLTINNLTPFGKIISPNISPGRYQMYFM